MKLKLKVKKNKRKRLVAWIQKNKDFEDSVQQLFRFFKNKISISKWSRIMKYYIISSENPGIILSFFSTIQELIPDVYFASDDSLELEELVNA
ncbi:MAG: hypothetical protein ACFFG0_36500 [Candidatus Thorarchaeota archaeon]